MATTKSQKKDISSKFEDFKNITKDVNGFVLETSEKIIDTTISSSEQWQNIGAKAVKGSLKIAANQQDIVFNTLETLKAQIIQGSKKMQGLFSKN